MNNYQRIAASLLKFRKANWDKARAADPEQMNAWAAIFQAAQVSYPDIVWQHAMLHLGKTMDEPPTAKDVLAGCRHVVAAAGVGSEVAVALDAHRNARLKARETSGAFHPEQRFQPRRRQMSHGNGALERHHLKRKLEWRRGAKNHTPKNSPQPNEETKADKHSTA